MGIIFVGGVHGVGKSTFCQNVSQRTGFQWFTASALIKAENLSAVTEGSRLVPNPSENQQLLIRAIRKQIGTSDNRALLDGHFTLLKPDNEIEFIDLSVFEQLRLDTILVLKDRPELICERLLRRDNQAWSVPLVSAHQDSEIQWASAVASALRVPILTINVHDSDSLSKAIGVFQIKHTI